ncbi:MAG: TetR/AcrR family transcriptional regulator [Ilumatobacteraceae bacterium]
MRPTGATREATSRRVLDAAVELFARHGFAATGIRDIAAAARLSSSSLYEYMTTKDDLLVDIMRATINPLIASGRVLQRDVESPAVLLAALTETHVWFHATYPHQAMVTDTELRALSGVQRELIVSLRDVYEGVWRDAVDRGVDAGAFDVQDVRVAARSLISLCTGIGGWYRPGGRSSIERLCLDHADLALAAVRATDGCGPVRRADLLGVRPARPAWSVTAPVPAEAMCSQTTPSRA